MKMTIRVRHSCFALIVMLAASCSSGTSSNPSSNNPNSTNTVTMTSSLFNPASITVTKGASVTWKNDDAIIHTSTGDNTAWDTGDMAGGVAKSVTFNTVGTFTYNCKYHVSMGMKGTVVVK